MTLNVPWVQAPAWVLNKPTNYTGFFSELFKLGFPNQATLFIEGSSFAPDVIDYLQPFVVEAEPPTGILKYLGFLRANIRQYHVPLQTAVLHQLDVFVENHASPEICDHLRVVCDKDVLLHWYDFPIDPVYVSNQVSEERVRSLARLLGTTANMSTEAV